jgi:hypothetical protein
MEAEEIFNKVYTETRDGRQGEMIRENLGTCLEK